MSTSRVFLTQKSNSCLLHWPVDSLPLEGSGKPSQKSYIHVYTVSSPTFFLGSKITADGPCSHEIKRHLLLGRKVMTNLDSIFQSRDITVPTKIRLLKAMVFPVVMYGCESWTVKKAER